MRSALPAAEQQALLCGLAERWGYQREGQEQDKRNGEDATHLNLTITQAGPKVQEKCEDAYLTGP